MNLIEQVLKLKAKVSEFRRPQSIGEARDQRDACSDYADLCCTAAPKLARALEVAMEGMRYLSRTTNEAAPIWCSDFIDTGNGPSMRFVLDSMKCEIETILNEGEPK